RAGEVGQRCYSLPWRIALLQRGSGWLVTFPDTPPFSARHHPVSPIALGWSRPVLMFTIDRTTGISTNLAIHHNAMMSQTNSRLRHEAIDDTWTGWTSMMTTAAFCGVSR
ncbi:MAG: hypothetical protein P4L98_24260, partial [Ancalomicrobiaceae bacterium]|nr:hypothetical protein [Ancalomicrobiaceae bacterium]